MTPSEVVAGCSDAVLRMRQREGQTPTIRAIMVKQFVIEVLSFIDFKAQQVLVATPAQDAVVGISGGAHVFIVQKRGWFNRVLHSLGWAK